MADFGFSEFNEVKQEIKPEPINLALEKKEEKEGKKKINFQELPKDTDQILNNKQLQEKYGEGEQIMPYEDNVNQSHLSTILSPNFRDLELSIRGLEYVKRWNPLTQKEEVILRKIKNHYLNDYGVNRIMSELRIYCSPEIKLGRKTERGYANSVQEASRAICDLIYQNLKSFGMDTQEKMRNFRPLCTAIIEFIDASFSRSLGGRENDASRPTEFLVQGSTDLINENTIISKSKKDQLKN